MAENYFSQDTISLIRDKTRRSDAVYQAMREAILSGQFEPRDWLRQEALADMLGVSQTTVREVLNRLVAEGLAQQLPHRGVQVAIIPANELEDIYELRALAEGLALEYAAVKITRDELSQMQRLLPRTVPDADPDTVEPARKANREFHMIAIRASGRRHLSRILGQLLDLTNNYVLMRQSTAEDRLRDAKADLTDHVEVLEALKARDGKRAREVVVEHLRGALRDQQRRMVRGESTGPPEVELESGEEEG